MILFLDPRHDWRFWHPYELWFLSRLKKLIPHISRPLTRSPVLIPHSSLDFYQAWRCSYVTSYSRRLTRSTILIRVSPPVTRSYGPDHILQQATYIVPDDYIGWRRSNWSYISTIDMIAGSDPLSNWKGVETRLFFCTCTCLIIN